MSKSTKTEKKRQHTVPQMYQRNFAINEDKTLIGVYHIQSDNYISFGAIKRQAYEKYFYGEDGSFEEYLSHIEGKANQIIQDIVKYNKVPAINTEEHVDLVKFVATLATRTTHEVEALEEMVNNYIEQTGASEEKKTAMYAEIEEGKRHNGLAGKGAMSVLNGIQTSVLLGDMKIKILECENDHSFITSDNPVVMYNLYMEKDNKPGSVIGFATVGLQMFMPISPTKCLIMYDDVVYHMGRKDSDVVKIHGKDVDNINRLEYLNANELVFFNDSVTGEYMNKLAEKYKKDRYDEKTEAALHKYEFKNNKLVGKYIRFSRKDLRIGLKMSYGFETDLARHLVIPKDTYLVRSKELLNWLRRAAGGPDHLRNEVKIMEVGEVIEEMLNKTRSKR